MEDKMFLISQSLNAFFEKKKFLTFFNFLNLKKNM